MSLKDAFLNVATLGGHGRLQTAIAVYNNVYEQYQYKHEVVSVLSEEIKSILIEIGHETEQSFHILSNALPFTRASLLERNNNNYAYPTLNSPKAQRAITDYSSTVTLATGAGASTAIALGSWTAVSFLGTASTGAAIGSLYGVASTNATLAWFGGGALAAGGGGMAAGMLTLGGLAVAPLIIFAAWNTHSKVPEVEHNTSKLIPLMETLDTEILLQRDVLQNLKSNLTLLKDKKNAFILVYESTIDVLFPRLIFSYIYRLIKSLFRRNFFSQDEYLLIVDLHKEVECFSEVFLSHSDHQKLESKESNIITLSHGEISMILLGMTFDKYWFLFVILIFSAFILLIVF